MDDWRSVEKDVPQSEGHYHLWITFPAWPPGGMRITGVFARGRWELKGYPYDFSFSVIHWNSKPLVIAA